MLKYQLEKYILHNSITGEMLAFPLLGNWETARGLAVESAVEMKEQSSNMEAYFGI